MGAQAALADLFPLRLPAGEGPWRARRAGAPTRVLPRWQHPSRGPGLTYYTLAEPVSAALKSVVPLVFLALTQ